MLFKIIAEIIVVLLILGPVLLLGWVLRPNAAAVIFAIFFGLSYGAFWHYFPDTHLRSLSLDNLPKYGLDWIWSGFISIVVGAIVFVVVRAVKDNL